MGHFFFLRIYEWNLVSDTYFGLVTKMENQKGKNSLNQNNNLLRFWLRRKG